MFFLRDSAGEYQADEPAVVAGLAKGFPRDPIIFLLVPFAMVYEGKSHTPI